MPSFNKKGIIKNIQTCWEKYIVDMIFPKECIGCGMEGRQLCGQCFSAINYHKQKTCIKCGRETTEGVLCKKCSHFRGIKNIVAAGDYNDKLWRDLIKYFKYHFIKDLAPDISELLKFYIEERLFPDSEIKKILSSPKTVLTAVPLHKKRKKWRGFNQSEEIAKNLSHQYGLCLSFDLIKTENKKPQTKLSGEKREENLKNCFIWRGEYLSGYNIILIDDVVTTGTTMFECASALKSAGAKNVFGLAVARG